MRCTRSWLRAWFGTHRIRPGIAVCFASSVAINCCWPHRPPTGRAAAICASATARSGITAGAVDRARGFVRAAARKSGGQLPPGAAHLTRANASLSMLRGAVSSALQKYESIASDDGALESLEYQTRMNLLKVTASELS